MPELYLDGYRSIIPQYSRELVNQAITLGFPVALPLPDFNPVLKTRKIKEDPYAYVPLSSLVYNEFVTSLYEDLKRLYASSNFVDNTISSLERSERDELSVASGAIDELEAMVDRHKNLRIGREYGFTILHHNTFDDDSSVETENIVYPSGVPRAERDPREKKLRLPVLGDFVRSKKGGRIPEAVISISRDSNGPIQYGRPLKSFKNLKDIRYAIDGSEETYWGEVVLSDEEIRVPLSFYGVEAEGGALCAFEIKLNDTQTISHLALKPYCEHPIKLLSILVAKADATSHTPSLSDGWLTTGIYVKAGEEYNLSSLWLAQAIGNVTLTESISGNASIQIRIVDASNTVLETVTIDDTIIPVLTSGTIALPLDSPEFTPTQSGFVKFKMSQGSNVILPKSFSVHYGAIRIGNLSILSADALINPTTVAGSSSVTSPYYLGLDTLSGDSSVDTGLPLYTLYDFSNTERYLTSSMRFNFAKQSNVAKVIVVVQQPHYTKENFLVSSEQRSKQELWQQMLGNFPVLRGVSFPGIKDSGGDGVMMLERLQDFSRTGHISKTQRSVLFKKYQYVYGFYDITLAHKVYGTSGAFVSKAYETKKNLVQAAILVDEKLLDDVSGDPLGVIEYDLAYGNQNQWHPVMPINQEQVSEIYTLATGEELGAVDDLEFWNGKVRMSPITEIVGITSLSSTGGLIKYIPSSDARYLDLVRLEEEEVRPDRLSETVVSGTDRHKRVTLKRAPYVNKGRVHDNYEPNGNPDNGEYVPITVSIEGFEFSYTNLITESTGYVKNVYQDTTHSTTRRLVRTVSTTTVAASGVVVGVENASLFAEDDFVYIYTADASKKEQHIIKLVNISGGSIVFDEGTAVTFPAGSFIEKVGSQAVVLPYVKNVTDYSGDSLPSLTPYDAAKHPVVEYIQIGGQLIFNIDIPEGVVVRASYDELVDNIRVRVVMRRHITQDSSMTPELYSYTLLLRDADDTSHEDRTGPSIPVGWLYKIPLPSTTVGDDTWKWFRIVSAGNAPDSVLIYCSDVNFKVYRDMNDDCYIEAGEDGEPDPAFVGKKYLELTSGDRIKMYPGEHILLGYKDEPSGTMRIISNHPYNYQLNYLLTGLSYTPSADPANQYFAPSVTVFQAGEEVSIYPLTLTGFLDKESKTGYLLLRFSDGIIIPFIYDYLLTGALIEEIRLLANGTQLRVTGFIGPSYVDYRDAITVTAYEEV